MSPIQTFDLDNNEYYYYIHRSYRNYKKIAKYI